MQGQTQGQGLDALNVKRHLLDVEQYHRMGDAGVFAPDARVELIEGELIDMAPMGTRHFAAVNRLNHLLTQAIGGRAIVSTQLPLRLNARSEPEPDISVLKLRDDFYESALPTGVDTFLVIEVSDSTLAYDLRIKAGLYARHGVPEYWVVDLPSRVLRVFRAAGPHGYRDATELPSPALMPIPGLDGVAVDLSILL